MDHINDAWVSDWLHFLIYLIGQQIKFLLLNETLASRVVFVVVSKSDGRADGNTLGASYTTRNGKRCVNGELTGAHGQAIECIHPRPVLPLTS